jgi:hypothetical protein
MTVWLHNPEGAGEYIIEAVGLPLVAGATAKELGDKAVTLLFVARLSGNTKHRSQSRENLKKTASLSK